MPVRVQQVKSKALPEEVIQIIKDMNCEVHGDNFFWWLVIDTKTKDWLAFTGARNIEEDKIYFGPTYVKPEARGKKLQLIMMKVKLRWAKRRGYSAAISSIFTYNIHSGNNLISGGFKMIKIPSYYPTDPTEVWFMKELH